MWTRFLNIFSTSLSAWRLSSSPLHFFLTLTMILLAPYLIYLLFGAVIFFIAIAIGGWLLYRYFKKQPQRW